MGPRFPLPGGQSQSGGGCSTTEEEASVRDLRTKGPQEQRSLQSLLAALGPVRSPDLSSLLDPTSGMSAVWSGQRKGALGRQGKPLYQKRFEQVVSWLASDLCWRAWPMDAAAIVENAGNSGRERRLGKGCEHVQTWSGVFHNRLENASRFPRSAHRPLLIYIQERLTLYGKGSIRGGYGKRPSASKRTQSCARSERPELVLGVSPSSSPAEGQWHLVRPVC